jgi:hypothetical protein
LQVEHGVVAIVTLKRRRFRVREAPIPPELMAALDRHFYDHGALPDIRRRAVLAVQPYHRLAADQTDNSVMAKIALSTGSPRIAVKEHLRSTPLRYLRAPCGP